MKNIIIILSLLPFSFLFAKPITIEQANNIALNFATLNHKNGLSINKALSPIKRSKFSKYKKIAQVPYYFINLKPKGWVLVSANDVIDPIIGFSFDANIEANTSLPPQLVDMLDGIESTIDYLESHGTHVKSKKISSQWDELSENPQSFKANIEDFRILHKSMRKKEKSVDPLLTTHWRQDAPFNALTPIIKETGQHALVGCVATALAQIMNYHKWPKRGKEVYTNLLRPDLHKLHLDFNTTFNWTNMSNFDKAKISYYVGVAVATEYTKEGSFAYLDSVSYILRKYFLYNCSEKETRGYPLFLSKKWDKRVQENLDKHLPILYEGRHSITPGISVPHAFVCDGYKYVNNNPYYHFNFGVDFRTDGFYNIHQTDRTNTYDKIHYYWGNNAIFDIKPKSIEAEKPNITQFQIMLPTLLMLLSE